MNLEDLELVSHILRIDGEEKKELLASGGRYDEEIAHLLDAYRKYSELLERKLSLDSRYASLNYKLYETFMEVHKNAIIISALKSEVSIRKIELGGEAEDRIDRLLKKYLIIEKFY